MVNAHRLYLYVQPSLCHSHWCTRTPMATLGIVGLLVYTYSVGFLLLLVPITRARGKAQERGASDSAGLHAFFLSLHYFS